MMRLTCLACSACTAFAMARYVLPVPAGPMPKTTVWLSMASTYRFWFSDLGRTVRPRLETIPRLRTSAGRSEVSVLRSSDIVRCTWSGPTT